MFVGRGLVGKLVPVSLLISAGKCAGRWHCCPAGLSRIVFLFFGFFLTFGHWLCTFLF